MTQEGNAADGTPTTVAIDQARPGLAQVQPALDDVDGRAAATLRWQQQLLSLASDAIADECASLQEGGTMDIPAWANIVVRLFASTLPPREPAHDDETGAEHIAIPDDMTEVEYWRRRAIAARTLMRIFKSRTEAAEAARERHQARSAENMRNALEFMLAYDNNDERALAEIQEAFNQQDEVKDLQAFAWSYCKHKMTAALASPAVAPEAAHADYYGNTDFGFAFAGLHMEEGDKRLAALIVRALGTSHPALDDFMSLLFRARSGAAQTQPAAATASASEIGGSSKGAADGEGGSKGDA